MNEARAKAISTNGGKIQQQRKASNNPRDEQIKKLISKPCAICWSDGSETRSGLQTKRRTL